MQAYRFLWILLTALPVLAADAWTERLDVSGDFRARYEVTDNDEGADRQRLRIRFRLQALWKLDDHFRVGARMVTGNPDDHRSTHQTLDDDFENFDFTLDRAWLDYRSGAYTARFGKFAHPFAATSIYDELFWDGDIQPEGISGSWRGDYLFAHGAYYVFDERGNDSDINALCAQLGGQTKKTLESSWALAYYAFGDQEDTLEQDYDLIDAQVAVAFPVAAGKLTCTAQWSNNTSSDVAEDTALAGGLAFSRDGFVKQCYAQYQRIENDAVLPHLVEDDFPSGRNFSGWVAGLKGGPWKKVECHLWVLTAKPLIGDGGTDVRWRFDLNMKI